MATINALGRTCAACGKEHKTSHLAYDPETLLPYCTHPYICNSDHPNSPTKLIKRQTEQLLVSYAEANAAHEKQLLDRYDPTIIERIKVLVSKPLTVRVPNPDTAKYLIELQEKMDFATMSDTVRYCIQLMQESNGLYYREHKRMEEEAELVKEVEQATTIKKPKKPKVTKEIPVSVSFNDPNPPEIEVDEPVVEEEELSF